MERGSPRKNSQPGGGGTGGRREGKAVLTAVKGIRKWIDRPGGGGSLQRYHGSLTESATSMVPLKGTGAVA